MAMTAASRNGAAAMSAVPATRTSNARRSISACPRAAPQEHRIGSEGEQVQKGRGVPEHSVAGDHQCVRGRVALRAEQAASEDDGPGVAHHAALAGELAL